MRKNLLMVIMVLIIGFLAACNEDDELVPLEVDFDVPETSEVGETVELKATVTYGDDFVTDADEVLFEVWEKGKQDESDKIDGENHGDGTYTLEYTFDRDGVFEMFAHTTAHELHTMPKKEITVGEGGDYSDVEEMDDAHDHDEHEDH